MPPIDEFEQQCQQEIKEQGQDEDICADALALMVKGGEYNYTYHFKWMGLPIIQYPQDIVAMQELIWEIKPDLIVETGVARGGSLVFYASMLELLGKNGQVVGVDIDIRSSNRKAIESHPMSKRISLVQGSSVDDDTVQKVRELAKGKDTVLVVLDSNHTHEHVLSELELYSGLVSKGSYMVVFDTVIEDTNQGFYKDKPWDKGNSPKTAVWEYLKSHSEFEIDRSIPDKLLITVAPDGFLKRVK